MGFGSALIQDVGLDPRVSESAADRCLPAKSRRGPGLGSSRWSYVGFGMSGRLTHESEEQKLSCSSNVTCFHAMAPASRPPLALTNHSSASTFFLFAFKRSSQEVVSPPGGENQL